MRTFKTRRISIYIFSMMGLLALVFRASVPIGSCNSMIEHKRVIYCKFRRVLIYILGEHSQTDGSANEQISERALQVVSLRGCMAISLTDLDYPNFTTEAIELCVNVGRRESSFPFSIDVQVDDR